MGGFSELDLGVARLQKFHWQVLSYITESFKEVCAHQREEASFGESLLYMGNSKGNIYNLLIFAKPNCIAKKTGIKIFKCNSVEKHNL